MADYAVFENNQVVDLIVCDSKELAESLTGKTCEESTFDIPLVIGLFYNLDTKVNIGPQPFASWTIVDNQWTPPVAKPDNGRNYKWNEDMQEWQSGFKFPSWIFDESLKTYVAPVPYPDDEENSYKWNEESRSWVII